MPLSKVGTMGGALLPQPQVRQTGDFAQEAEVAIAGDGAISNTSTAFPIQQACFSLNKGSAAAITLGAPNLLQSGTVLAIASNTAFAHVVTSTALINDGVAGAPHGVLTFAAFPGCSIVLVASKGLWNVLSKNGVTIT